MSNLDDDCGVVPWKPPLEYQLKEIERKRLIYGQFTTADLKRRVPTAFEPSVVLLLLQFVEAQDGVARFKSLYERANSENHGFATEFLYDVVALERSAKISERRVAKALQRLGYIGDIPQPMIKLAEQAKLGELAAFIVENSPAGKRLLLELDGNAQ